MAYSASSAIVNQLQEKKVGAAIPFLKICEEGLVDFKTGKTLGLFQDVFL